MTLELKSPCKINLLLNILGRRADGFHELETIMHSVPLHDILRFQKSDKGIRLTCSDPALPTGPKNLVYRAAENFFDQTQLSGGVQIHLEKKIPHAAGLGGGSGDAATTFLGLNQLYDFPASPELLHELAASLGSDIPFFLQDKPAFVTGRGEKIEPLNFFPALRGFHVVLIHPGFGISTPWAYQKLAEYPEALNGRPGRAARLISLLRENNLEESSSEFYNSLEAPALKKYPLLILIQEFLRENGAAVALMSGSGSATFGLVSTKKLGEEMVEKFKAKFGTKFWTAVVPLRED